MKLNHLNLTVSNAIEVRDFLQKYFGLKTYTTAGKAFVGMVDDDGFLLNLMLGKEINYPESFHVGFPQDTKEDVDALNQRLQADGYEVNEPSEMHGSYTFYLKAPGGITLEAYTQLDGVDPSKGPFPDFSNI
ncbi:catechol-2,3-dioxygenase [Paenibacillus shirakamiensis]|uniref:Catechol-2,3-dioxygenase n=1 Tax=Paenibacillus shirakamiensis TaxID=1265935 RepID=A0ABS4JGM0_9BACL|nr:VOC family protein [Paenibacillus shirakamiensis]MBP2000185.1 catechol-2,3-dioxygenase [Paenibacillus shirakamiensis]